MGSSLTILTLHQFGRISDQGHPHHQSVNVITRGKSLSILEWWVTIKFLSHHLSEILGETSKVCHLWHWVKNLSGVEYCNIETLPRFWYSIMFPRKLLLFQASKYCTQPEGYRKGRSLSQLLNNLIKGCWKNSANVATEILKDSWRGNLSVFWRKRKVKISRSKKKEFHKKW